MILFIIIYRCKCRADSDEKKSEYEKTSKVGNYFKTYYLKSNIFYSMEWGKPLPAGIGGFLESENPTISLENMRYDIMKIIKTM